MSCFGLCRQETAADILCKVSNYRDNSKEICLKNCEFRCISSGVSKFFVYELTSLSYTKPYHFRIGKNFKTPLIIVWKSANNGSE